MPYRYYERTEKQHGRPMAQILLPLLNSPDLEFDDVAGVLSINPTTLWKWCKRARIKRCYVATDDCKGNAVEAKSA